MMTPCTPQIMPGLGQTHASKYLLFWNICKLSAERKIYVTYNTVTTAHFCNYYHWRGLDCRVSLCCPDFWWFSHNFSSVVLCFVANIDEFHLSIFCKSFRFIIWLVFNIFFWMLKIFFPAILTWWWWGSGRRCPSAPWRRHCWNTRLPTRRPSRSVYHL